MEELCAAIRGHRPRRIPLGRYLRTAAVAVVLRPSAGGPELLLIRRPRRSGDRWGGHVAFPGGLMQDGDRDPDDAARREAAEEVGLNLGAPLGHLSELLTAQPGRARPLRVVSSVFATDREVRLAPDAREVAAIEWRSLRALAADETRLLVHRVGKVRAPVRAMRLPIGTLWGLTFAMVRELLRIAPASATS